MNLSREKGRVHERERKLSLSSAMPVIAIEHPSSTSIEVTPTPVRKSLSLTTFDISTEEESRRIMMNNDHRVLQIQQLNSEALPIDSKPLPVTPPSPKPMDLSTIVEADTSGISKHLPSAPNSTLSSPPSRFPSHSPSPSPFLPSFHHDHDVNDDSHLELEFSTSQITSQFATDWLKDVNARVVDVDADESLPLDDEPEPSVGGSLIVNLETVDPALAALLSPHKIPPGPVPGQIDNENDTIVLPKPVRSTYTPLPATSHVVQDLSQHPQRQSSLPRLRSHQISSPSSSSTVVADAFKSSSFDIGVKDDQSRNQAQNRNHLREHKGIGHQPTSPSEAPIPPSSSGSTTTNLQSPPSATLPTLIPTPSTPDIPSAVSSAAYPPPSLSTMSRITSPHNPSASTSLIVDVNSEIDSSPPLRGHKHRNLGLRCSSSPSSQLSTRNLDAEYPERGSLDSPAISPRRPYHQTRLAEHPCANEHGEIIFGRGSLDLEPSPRITTSSAHPSTLELRRQRKRSMSVEGHHLFSSLGRYPGPRSGAGSSVTPRFGARPSSSLSARQTDDIRPSGRPMTEWLGPRTAKAFRAAGLLGHDQDGEDSSFRPSPPPGVGQTRRYGSLRSTTSRAQSRAEGHRRGSGSYLSGTSIVGMESPTFTISSSRGEREWPPRSVSTAPTSVSGISNGREWEREREREREKEESTIVAMKDKHALETSALLSALADSQRTTRVVREENEELRERLQEVERLEDVCDGLRRELTRVKEDNERLKRFVADYVVRDRDAGTRTAMEQDTRRRTKAFLANKGSLGRHAGTATGSLHQIVRAATPPSPSPPPTATKDSFKLEDNHLDPFFTLASTPAKIRRFSTASSSVFPAPPANMTMLNEEKLAASPDVAGYFSQSESDASGSRFRSIPWSAKNDKHTRDTSILSISNFSVTTGSPGSLCLRPEHELHLGDMESLDLGAGRANSGDEEEW
ncbi:hypothetical protein E1B28_001323 [Marasmius oreades]|nr:uncharacterized protein E1B28_001323 [Marasmius oreades]KAG7099475.1 hypothetical protein E1B28_001323 [Marasmius oreades]